MFFEIIDRIKFFRKADRIGPDIPLTHWRLHFKSTMTKLCRGKFGFFGENAEFRPGAYAITCSNISIGKNVILRPGTMLFANEKGKISIQDNVLVGSGVHFYVNNHRFDDANIPIIDQGYYPSQDILVKEGAWIGANAIILPGVTIGVNCVVGAGSVVTKSTPDSSVVVGIPARVIKEISPQGV